MIPRGPPPPPPTGVTVAPPPAPPRQFTAPHAATMRPPPSVMTRPSQRRPSIEVMNGPLPPPPVLAAPPVPPRGGGGPPPTPPPPNALRPAPASFSVPQSAPAPPPMRPPPSSFSSFPNAPGLPTTRGPPPVIPPSLSSRQNGVSGSQTMIGSHKPISINTSLNSYNSQSQQQSDSTPGTPTSAPSTPSGPPPRTLFEVTHKTKDPKRDCKASGCYSRAEIGGKCIKHYYESSDASPSPSSSAAHPSPPGLSSHANGTTSKQQKELDERRQLCEELVLTEKSYGKGLKNVVRGIILRLNKYEELNPGKGLMEKDEMLTCFLNISDIFDLQQQLYQELKELRFRRELEGPGLGILLVKLAPFFKLYVPYVNQFDESQKKLLELRESRPALDAFLKLCEAVEGGRIADFMISPVQRVPRYALLLRAIEKVTAADNPSLTGIRTALSAIEQVASDINESFRKKEARARVIEIAEHIEGLQEQLVTPHRYFIRDGPLDKKYNKTSFKLNDWKTYFFFLFNDLLIYTTIPNSKGFCKMKYTLPLSDMTLNDVPNTEKISHAFELGSSVKSFMVMASSAAEKLAWMEAITNAVNSLNKNSATLKLQPSKSQLQRDGSVINIQPPHPSASRNGSYISGSGTLQPGWKMQ